MKKVLLTDVCDIQYGYPFDSTLFNDREGTPLIRIRDIVRGFSETYTTEQAPKDYLVYQGDILVGMDGEFNVAKWGGTPGVLNQRVCRIFPSRLIDKEYLFHYLPVALKRIEDATPFVTVKHLSAKALAKIQIPAHEPLLQTKIANSLSGICSLINIRKAQLLKLDQLASSRFIEMFGDPIANPKSWTTGKLSEVTDKIGSGATPQGGKESYITSGISLIRSMNIHNGKFEYKDLAHITEEQAQQLNNVNVKSKDVFINITGASVARSCVVPDDVLPARVNQHVSIIRCKQNILNPIFANSLFISLPYQRTLLAIGESGGATRQAITKQQLENLMIILPSLELQNEFAAFIEQLDKSKVTIRKSIEKLETTYRALLQEYFG